MDDNNKLRDYLRDLKNPHKQYMQNVVSSIQQAITEQDKRIEAYKLLKDTLEQTDKTFSQQLTKFIEAQTKEWQKTDNTITKESEKVIKLENNLKSAREWIIKNDISKNIQDMCKKLEKSIELAQKKINNYIDKSQDKYNQNNIQKQVASMFNSATFNDMKRWADNADKNLQSIEDTILKKQIETLSKFYKLSGEALQKKLSQEVNKRSYDKIFQPNDKFIKTAQGDVKAYYNSVNEYINDTVNSADKLLHERLNGQRLKSNLHDLTHASKSRQAYWNSNSNRDAKINAKNYLELIERKANSGDKKFMMTHDSHNNPVVVVYDPKKEDDYKVNGKFNYKKAPHAVLPSGDAADITTTYRELDAAGRNIIHYVTSLESTIMHLSKVEFGDSDENLKWKLKYAAKKGSSGLDLYNDSGKRTKKAVEDDVAWSKSTEQQRNFRAQFNLNSAIQDMWDEMSKKVKLEDFANDFDMFHNKISQILVELSNFDGNDVGKHLKNKILNDSRTSYKVIKNNADLVNLLSLYGNKFKGAHFDMVGAGGNALAAGKTNIIANDTVVGAYGQYQSGRHITQGGGYIVPANTEGRINRPKTIMRVAGKDNSIYENASNALYKIYAETDDGLLEKWNAWKKESKSQYREEMKKAGYTDSSAYDAAVLGGLHHSGIVLSEAVKKDFIGIRERDKTLSQSDFAKEYNKIINDKYLNTDITDDIQQEIYKEILANQTNVAIDNIKDFQVVIDDINKSIQFNFKELTETTTDPKIVSRESGLRGQARFLPASFMSAKYNGIDMLRGDGVKDADLSGYMIAVIQNLLINNKDNQNIINAIVHDLTQDVFADLITDEGINADLYSELNIKKLREEIEKEFGTDTSRTTMEALNTAFDYEHAKESKFGSRETKAVQRAIHAAAMANSEDFSALIKHEEFKLSPNDKEAQKKLSKLSNSVWRTNESAVSGNENKQYDNNITVGYGDNYDIDLSQYANDDSKFNIDFDSTTGRATKESFESSILKDIDEVVSKKQEEYFKNHPELTDEQKQKYRDDFTISAVPLNGQLITMKDHSSNRYIGGSSFYMPANSNDFIQDYDNHNEGQYVLGTMAGPMLSLLRTVAQNGRDLNNGKAKEEIAQQAIKYQNILDEQQSSKESEIWDAANSRRIKGSHSFVLKANNNALIEQYANSNNSNEKMYADILDNSITFNREDMLQMIGKNKDALKAQYKMMFGDISDIPDSIPELQAAILNGLTFGTEEFNQNLSHNKGKAVGITMRDLRFPTIAGQDVRYAQGFVGIQNRGQVNEGSSLALTHAADFDRDHSQFAALINGISKRENAEAILDQGYKVARQQADYVSQAVHNVNKTRTKDDKKDNAIDIDINDEKKITEKAKLMAQVNKGQTGRLSTMATEFRNALDAHKLSELTGNDKTDMATGILARSLMEKLEQDAISAKHIAERYNKILADEGIDKAKQYLEDVDTQLQDFNDAISSGQMTKDEFFKRIGSGEGGMGIFSDINGDDAIIRSLAEALQLDKSDINGEVSQFLQKQFGFSKEQLDLFSSDASKLKGTISLDQYRKIFDYVEEKTGASIFKTSAYDTNSLLDPRYREDNSQTLSQRAKRKQNGGKLTDSQLNDALIINQMGDMIQAGTIKTNDSLQNFVNALIGAINGINNFSGTINNATSQFAERSMGVTSYLNTIIPRNFQYTNYKPIRDKINLLNTDEQALRSDAMDRFNKGELKQDDYDKYMSELLGIDTEVGKELFKEARQYGIVTPYGSLVHSNMEGNVDNLEKESESFISILQSYGYSDEDIKKLKTRAELDAQLIKETEADIKNTYHGTEAIREIKFNEDKIYGKGQNRFQGIFDAITFEEFTDQHGVSRTRAVNNDYKTNRGGKVKGENVAQVLKYINLYREMVDKIQEYVGDNFSGKSLNELDDSQIEKVASEFFDAKDNSKAKDLIKNIGKTIYDDKTNVIGRLIAVNDNKSNVYDVTDNRALEQIAKSMFGDGVNIAGLGIEDTLKILQNNAVTKNTAFNKIGDKAAYDATLTSVEEEAKKEYEAAKSAKDRVDHQKQLLLLIQKELALRSKIAEIDKKLKYDDLTTDMRDALVKNRKIYENQRKANDSAYKELTGKTKFLSNTAPDKIKKQYKKEAIYSQVSDIVDAYLIRENNEEGKFEHNADKRAFKKAQRSQNAFFDIQKKVSASALNQEDAQRKFKLAHTDRERQAYQSLINYEEAERKILEEDLRIKEAEYKKDVESGDLSKESLDRLKQEFDLKKKEIAANEATRRAQNSIKHVSDRNFFDILKTNVQGSFSRYFNFNLVSRGISAFTKELRQLITITQQLDQVATNIRIVTGQNKEDVDNLMISYTDLAKQLGTTTTAVAASANEWLRQGYNVNEVNNLITASTQLSKLGMLESGQATEYLTSALKGFKLEAESASTIVDKLTTLDMNYAASAGDIAEALSRTAAVAQEAGMSLDETSAAVTVIMDVTQQGAEMTGTALRSIMSRFGQVKAGSFNSLMEGSEEDAENLNDIEKVLGNIGIEMRSSTMDMRDFSDVLDDLSNKWAGLTDVEKNAVATAMAGTRQRNSFLVLMENYDRYQEAIETSANSTGMAEVKYQAYMESLEYQTNRLTAAWEELSQKIINSEGIKFLMKTAVWMVENLPTILKYAGSIISTIQSYKAPAAFAKLKAFFTLTPAQKSEEYERYGGTSRIQRIFNPKKRKEAAKTYRDFYKNGGEPRSITDTDTSVENTAADKVVAAADKVVSALDKNANATTENTQEEQKEAANIKENTTNVKENTSASKDETSAEKQSSDATEQNTDAVKQNTLAENSDGDSGTGTGVLTGGKAGKSGTGGISAAMALTAGLGAGISSFLTNTNTWSKQFGTEHVELNDIESDLADRAVSGTATAVATGALSMIPYVGPLIGGIAGPLIGDAIGGVFKKERHAEEIARAERVAVAKEQLEAMGQYTDAVNNAVDTFGNKAIEDYVSDDYALLNTTVEEFNEMISNVDLVSAGLIDEFENNLEDLSVSTANATEALKSLADGNYVSEIVSAMKAAQIKTQAQIEYAASETERKTAQDNLNAARDALEEAKSNGDATEIKRQEALISAYNTQIQSYENNLKEANMQSAFYTSGLNSMSTFDIENASIDRLIYQLVSEWAEDNPEVFLSTGKIADSAYNQAYMYIKSQSGFENVDRSKGNKSVTEVLKGIAAITTAAGTTNTVDLLDIASNKSRIDELTQIGIKLGIIKDESDASDENLNAVRDAINNMNVHTFENMAHGLGMTSDQLADANDKLGWLTSDDITNGVEGLVETFAEWNNILEDLTDNLTLGADTLDSIAKNYSYLMLDSEGNISADNISNNLIDMVLGNNSKALTAYAQMRATELMSDESTWELFKQSNAFSDLFTTDGSLLKGYESKLKSATITSFNAAYEYLANNVKDFTKDNNDFNFITGFSSVVEELIGDPEIIDIVESKINEFLIHTYELEISNLESIRDNLDEINNSREKELELLKAKEKLENTRNEKKRVYRAGVGWTYEADQQAISDAQEELKKLETEQEKENIQYQIDLLEQQKNTLENIEENEKWESVQKLYEGFANGTFNLGLNGDAAGILNEVFNSDVLQSALKNVASDTVYRVKDVYQEKLESNVTDALEKKEKYYLAKKVLERAKNNTSSINEVASAMDTYESARSEYSNALETIKDYNSTLIQGVANEDDNALYFDVLNNRGSIASDTSGQYVTSSNGTQLTSDDLRSRIGWSTLGSGEAYDNTASYLTGNGLENSNIGKKSLAGSGEDGIVSVSSKNGGTSFVKYTDFKNNVLEFYKILSDGSLDRINASDVPDITNDRELGEKLALNEDYCYYDVTTGDWYRWNKNGGYFETYSWFSIRDKNSTYQERQKLAAYLSGDYGYASLWGNDYGPLINGQSKYIAVTDNELEELPTSKYNGEKFKINKSVENPSTSLDYIQDFINTYGIGDGALRYGSYTLQILLTKGGNKKLSKYNMKNGENFFDALGELSSEDIAKLVGVSFAYASGTLNSAAGAALINELGTEGIITPSGTLTALPAHSGVVPADLTKNLYDLGEVAPTMIKRWAYVNNTEPKGQTSNTDNSMNVQNLYATFETDDGFDFEKLLVQARQYVATTRHNKG